ncbi:MAG: MarR family transcriptional regulator [Alphaproteobacteria bacterium]|nr:MarR family transcriptional regulator [Alphaproteobacteria bacterium]
MPPGGYERLAAFRHALRRFLAFSEAAARAEGLTAQQHQALLAVKAAPPGESASVGYLAEQLLLAPNSAAELADRMVRVGLIERHSAQGDRRRVILTLTPAAEGVLWRLSAGHLRELREAAPALEALTALVRDPAGRRPS